MIDYNAADDFSRSINECYRVVRERKAAGGMPWPRDGFVGYDEQGHFVHYCKCGAWAAFGYGFHPRQGRLGTWYCGACNLARQEESRHATRVLVDDRRERKIDSDVERR